MGKVILAYIMTGFLTCHILDFGTHHSLPLTLGFSLMSQGSNICFFQPLSSVSLFSLPRAVEKCSAWETFEGSWSKMIFSV